MAEGLTKPVQPAAAGSIEGIQNEPSRIRLVQSEEGITGRESQAGVIGRETLDHEWDDSLASDEEPLHVRLDPFLKVDELPHRVGWVVQRTLTLPPDELHLLVMLDDDIGNERG